MIAVWNTNRLDFQVEYQGLRAQTSGALREKTDGSVRKGNRSESATRVRFIRAVHETNFYRTVIRKWAILPE